LETDHTRTREVNHLVYRITACQQVQSTYIPEKSMC
jgi:hypothetical protein